MWVSTMRIGARLGPVWYGGADGPEQLAQCDSGYVFKETSTALHLGNPPSLSRDIVMVAYTGIFKDR